ncbi:MAG: reverse transcriptase domain-containing protein, partial [Luteolibacter sp.]
SEYRPITKYPTDDNIIQKLTLRYLSDQLDSFFSDSSHAYRKFRNKSETQFNRDSALRHIAAFKKAHRTLYVAEADIRNFMDCVAHVTASQALRSLIMQAKMKDPGIDVDPRAIQLYDAFLAGYSFRRDVLGKATEELNKKDKKGYFAWPAEELAKMHGEQDLDAIGIPQGGALSCFVVNVMLHEVDQAVEGIEIPDGHEMLYERFCDDMQILSTDKEVCHKAMEAYLSAIKHKKLLVHEPVDVPHANDHESHFHILDLKSKNPYLWARQEDGGIPWIQFLGYLIQYDGQFQIRPKSIDKQIQKMNDEARKLFERIHPAGVRLKMKPHEILVRFNKKLVAMSVGLRNHKQPLPACSADIEPMCWANGYKYLWEVPYDPNQLRALDRHRERVMMQIYRRLEPFMLSKEDGAYADRMIQKIRKHGFRYSYYGQFAKKTEADQSPSLSNAPPRDDPKARFRHVVSSMFRWLCRW